MMNKEIRDFYNYNPYPDLSVFAKVRLPGRLFEQASEMLGKKVVNKPKILVAGCGVVSVAAIAAQYPQAEIICALDISEKTIQKAQRSVRKSSNNIHWVCTDLTVDDIQDVLPEPYFDWIHCTGVLHHLESPEAGIKNLSKLLKPEGIIRFQFYSKGARFWIELLRQALLTHNIESYSDAVNWLKSLPDSHPFWFVLSTYPEALKKAGFLDAFMNPQVKLLYADEWQTLFNKYGLSINKFDKDLYLNDAQMFLSETMLNKYNQLDYFTKVFITEALGEWRSDFSGFAIKKCESVQFKEPERPQCSFVNIDENSSCPRYSLWNEVKLALRLLNPDIQPHELNYVVNNLFERQWATGFMGNLMRLKWSALNDRSRHLVSYDYLLKNNLDLFLADISNKNYYQIPDFQNWQEKQWLDGFYKWQFN